MVSMGQTITVVNKSGKIVSNSKHIVNVFKEAKSAYREKKAELRQEREAEIERQLREQARQKKKQYALDDDDARSVTSSRSGHSHTSRRSSASHRSHRTHHRDDGHRSSSGRSQAPRPTVERGFSDGFVDPVDTAPSGPRRASTHRLQASSPLKNSCTADDIERGELLRRKSESDGMAMLQMRRDQVPPRDEVDMDLAYGELPPAGPTRRIEDEQELRQKMTALQRMLEEANCLQHSATAIIKNLEGNPEAMAAVALTLAEVSSLAGKLAPGALLSLKGAFPAVVALLVSPEFLIAGGVAVGVTVIAFGGYKIIKKMKAKKALEGDKTKELLIEDEMVADNDDLESIHSLDRIEQWRRGIQFEPTDSPGSSVEGEYITPGAASQLRSEGKLPPKKDKATRDKERKDAERDKKEKAKREKADKDARKAKDKADKKLKDKDSKRDKKSVFSSRRTEVVGDYI